MVSASVNGATTRRDTETANSAMQPCLDYFRTRSYFGAQGPFTKPDQPLLRQHRWCAPWVQDDRRQQRCDGCDVHSFYRCPRCSRNYRHRDRGHEFRPDNHRRTIDVWDRAEHVPGWPSRGYFCDEPSCQCIPFAAIADRYIRRQAILWDFIFWSRSGRPRRFGARSRRGYLYDSRRVCIEGLFSCHLSLRSGGMSNG